MEKFKLKKIKAKNNAEIHLREAQVVDASKILDFARIVFTTSPYTLTQESDFHFNLELEEKWIESAHKSKTSLILIVLFEEKVIGMIDLRGSDKKRDQHRVHMGMALLPDWRNLGIGRLILTEVIEFCRKDKIIKKIDLGVIGKNSNAVKLYQSLGFIDEGRSLKGFFSDESEYLDEVHMGLWTGDAPPVSV